MGRLTQPQLGETILALRQEQKLTQEELVEQCNLNVRTLQRIEAGDVTPRDYTIRAILTALDYDFKEIESSIRNKVTIGRLQYGWIAGIAYFLLSFFEAGIDFARFEDSLPFYFPLMYTAIKTLVLVSFTFFMIGFVEVGRKFESSLLKVSSYLMVGSLFVIEFYDIISIFSEMTEDEFFFIKSAEAMVFGGVDVVFGIALFRMGKTLGTTSTLAGVFEILTGICFMTFILALFGLVLLIPATILEIILLHNCYEMLQAKE